ncbi:hypothetical protein [Pelagibacterium sp. H642]|uniref:hypothetical protein n=1 Tax=Pelagibacterium sp. H642 TaxID=1881069 RepID=UPI0028158683|nr:hypothetical protein [Pelagibacterium sp. H642]WMT92626.1 hypothetical protein NO934_19970 [Pelagibacterium sp. H642]
MHKDLRVSLLAKLLNKLGIGKMIEGHEALEWALEQLRDGLDQIKEMHEPEWESLSAELQKSATSMSPIMREAFEKVFARAN